MMFFEIFYPETDVDLEFQVFVVFHGYLSTVLLRAFEESLFGIVGVFIGELFGLNVIDR